MTLGDRSGAARPASRRSAWTISPPVGSMDEHAPSRALHRTGTVYGLPEDLANARYSRPCVGSRSQDCSVALLDHARSASRRELVKDHPKLGVSRVKRTEHCFLAFQAAFEAGSKPSRASLQGRALSRPALSRPIRAKYLYVIKRRRLRRRWPRSPLPSARRRGLTNQCQYRRDLRCPGEIVSAYSAEDDRSTVGNGDMIRLLAAEPIPRSATDTPARPRALLGDFPDRALTRPITSCGRNITLRGSDTPRRYDLDDDHNSVQGTERPGSPFVRWCCERSRSTLVATSG